MNRWVEIDLEAIKNNIALIKKEIGHPKTKLMTVVKANAYGHGLVEISKICEETNVDYLAVSTFDEAKTLRGNGVSLPILIIGYIYTEDIEKAISDNITLSIYSREIADEVIKAASKLNKVAKVHLKIDTGMHRLGFLPEEFIQNYQELILDKNLNIEFIYSHFADFHNEDYSQKQIEVLKKILGEIKNKKLPIPKVHFSRSESLTNDKVDFAMVRPGLALYGLCDNIAGLKPALTFKTKIAQVKNIKAGDCVGYCLTFKAEKPMKIATIACGYADGYGRNFSNKGEVIVGGKKCPVIGRVCMNLTIVDVNEVNNAKMGDEVILIGKNNGVEISANELAEKIDTIPYEIVSRIPADIPRIYKSDAKT